MLISTKNKKSSIIKGVTLLLACVMLFTLVLTSCDGSDALEAAQKAQAAADAAKTAADAAKVAADNARIEADAAKADAETAIAKANAAMTSADVAKAIQDQLTDQLKNYAKTADVNTLIQTKLTEALGAYFTKEQVSTEIQSKLASYMTSTQVNAAIATVTAQFANYMTSAQVATAIEEKLALTLTEYTTDADVAAVFDDFINEYNSTSVVAVDTYLAIDEVIDDMLTNAALYPTASVLDTIKALTRYQLLALRVLTNTDAQAIATSADEAIAACKSYPQIAYEAYLAVDEFIYPIANGTVEQNPYSSQDQMDAYLAAITINTGDATRDATIMAAIRSYVVDENTTLDLEAEYNALVPVWNAIKNFGEVTAPQLIDAIDAIDDDYATITLDQTTRYAQFKNDVDAADAIYTDAKTAIGATNVNFTRLITNLQKLIDAKAYKATLAQLEAVPSDYIDRIDVLLGSTGWTASSKVLFSTYKNTAAEDGSIALLKAEVEAWATTNNIPVENISTLITNYDALVSAYNYGSAQYDEYVAFTADVKPAIESANAAILALSNEALFTDAKTELDAWLSAGVDDINLAVIYVDPMKATFEAGLARIAQLNAAKTAAIVINDKIATYGPPAEITIHTKAELLTYLENTIQNGWCVTYAIPYDTADALYIAENYALVNVAELNGYMEASQDLIDEVIVKGENFVNAVKAIPGYNEVIGNNQATLYSYANINAAKVLYNQWSDENLITDLMFDGLAKQVSDHYAIWTLLSSQYDTLEAAAIADFATPTAAIDAIGDVNIYSGTAITDAQTAYDAWMTQYLAEGTTGAGLKSSIVTMVNAKASILETSKTTYAALKGAKDTETANVIALINAIPTPVTTASFDAITAARTAYDTWVTNIDLAKDDYVVTNYAALVSAEADKANIIALATTANASIDALKALTLDPATEATTNEYKNAIDQANTDLDAFITANGGNDYNYVSEAQITAIADAEAIYAEYQFQNDRTAVLNQLQADYDTVCADPANAAYVGQLTTAYDQQVARINLIDHTLTYNGYTATEEMNRLLVEFQFQINSILGK